MEDNGWKALCAGLGQGGINDHDGELKGSLCGDAQALGMLDMIRNFVAKIWHRLILHFGHTVHWIIQNQLDEKKVENSLFATRVSAYDYRGQPLILPTAAPPKASSPHVTKTTSSAPRPFIV